MPSTTHTTSTSATPHDAVIHITALTKSFVNGPSTLRVLRGLDLTVRRGEWVAIIGASGSGKSTLLNILGLLNPPDSGRYVLDGVDTAGLDDDQLTALRNASLGFIFQRFNLLGRTSAADNVATPLLYSRISAREREQRSLAALASVGLADRTDHDPSQLSGGQMQRVAIARALVTKPAVLLADEPTGNLDEASGTEIMSLFRDLHERGRTIVMITHDLEVARAADRQLRLRDGVLYDAGPELAAAASALARS